MKTDKAITYIKKEVTDFDIYPLKEREIVIAAFKMGWDMKGRHDLQLLVVTQAYTAPAISPKDLAVTKSGARVGIKERVRG